MDNKNENKDSRLQPAAQDAKKALSSEDASWLENLFQSNKIPEVKEPPKKEPDPAAATDLELEMILRGGKINMIKGE